MFERFFDHVFTQCVAQGLVAGDTQAVDSAPVKANAALDAVLQKQPPGPRGPAHQLRNLAARQAWLAVHSSVPGSRHPKARLLSIKTHYSPTDPDARISLKPSKIQALNYLCSLVVDTAHGIISHMQADFADKRDSLHLPRLLTGLQRRLRAHELPLRALLADAG